MFCDVQLAEMSARIGGLENKANEAEILEEKVRNLKSDLHENQAAKMQALESLEVRSSFACNRGLIVSSRPLRPSACAYENLSSRGGVGEDNSKPYSAFGWARTSLIPLDSELHLFRFAHQMQSDQPEKSQLMESEILLPKEREAALLEYIAELEAKLQVSHFD